MAQTKKSIEIQRRKKRLAYYKQWYIAAGDKTRAKRRENYLSKIEHYRQYQREYKRKKYGYKPRKPKVEP